MTESPPLQRKPLILAVSLLSWIVIYLLAHASQEWLCIQDKPSLFLAASMLTFLSVSVVIGFSHLQQHRNIYLLLGILGVILTFYSADPLVKRAALINKTGDIPRQVADLTIKANGLIHSEKIIASFQSAIFSTFTIESKKAIPENHISIMLLCLAQLLLASGIGLWIGEGIDEASHLIPVAIVATVADIWSVSAGATAKIIVSPAINYFLLRFPMPGNASIPYLIGLTDFLFFAIFFKAAAKFNLGKFKNSAILTASFFVAFTTAIFYETGLPVLPFMALFFVAGNFSRLRLKREEIKQIAFFVVFIILMFTIVSRLIN